MMTSSNIIHNTILKIAEKRALKYSLQFNISASDFFSRNHRFGE